MKPIVHVPNHVLTSPAQPITSFDRQVKKLIFTMKATLLATKNPRGVGLAAVQIGEPYRIFVTMPRENSAVRAFVNPEITKSSRELTDGVPARNASQSVAGGPERENKLEGCLSIPGIWGRVRRAARITLRYQDEMGKSHEESFEGFLATIIQHETDHVNGILYTQRVLEQGSKLYKTAKDGEGKERLEEISLL